MKKIFWILIISCILTSGCFYKYNPIRIHNYKLAIEEQNILEFNNGGMLIAIYTKITKLGSIVFLEKINENEVLETSYFYSIKLDSNKVLVRKYEERNLFFDNIDNYITLSDYSTSDEFNKRYRSKWLKKYYKCFSNNFLEITNKERKQLMDSLSKINI